jgi:hypothetical protein
VQDAEGLHPHFAHMLDWQQVRDAERFDESFLWVEARLQDGFNSQT